MCSYLFMYICRYVYSRIEHKLSFGTGDLSIYIFCTSRPIRQCPETDCEYHVPGGPATSQQTNTINIRGLRLAGMTPRGEVRIRTGL